MTAVGDIRVLPDIGSHGLKPRDLLVYVPRSLERGGGPYPVLYMHDGQNLFDDATSFVGEWGVDDAAEAMGAEVIVVGIPNAGEDRINEYGPWPVALFGSTPKADAYLGYISDTVRPLIQSRFPVRTDRDGVGIAGSSMGGLISLYAALERPDEYGFCGAFSPAVIVSADPCLEYVAAKAGEHIRAYVDVGTAEDLLGGPEPYMRDVQRLRDMLIEKGAHVTYIEDEGAEHNETAWRRRFPSVLELFLSVGARA